MAIQEATYISIWNDGETEVHSDVLVDFDEMEITGWGDRTYVGVIPEDDSELTDLVEEKVVGGMGMEFTAMSSDAWHNYGQDDEAAYDEYGNGIIVYD